MRIISCLDSSIALKIILSMAKYLDPKSDLTFKKVFGEHKELLISISEAEQKGYAEASNSVASKMKADGMSIEMIQKYTGLTLGEIEKL